MADLGQSAEQLFAEALELQPEQRAAFLDQACRGAPELRRLVEELLRDNQLAGSFLAEPILTPDGGATVSVTQSTASRHLSAGTKLGRYSIIEPLGAGGMGVVYRARDEKLERVVAIKLLAPGVFTGDEARRRFHKEALALAKLSHAHIAAVYDVGEQDGVDYIVMECVPGESLAAKIKAGPLTVKDATSTILQIAEALEEAHEQGVIHRDLKPANVMVTPKGQAKVLDFGLAKLLAVARDPTVSVTETRGLIGTPLYMSPEQAQEQNLDARTDLWNLGVIYYELLTGRAPFRADSSIAVLRAITDEAPVPLRQLRPDVPPLCEQIVSHALEKNPDRRYQSATEIIRDTSELLSGLSTTSLDQEKPANEQIAFYSSQSQFLSSGDHGGPLVLLSLIPQALGARRSNSASQEPARPKQTARGLSSSRQGRGISAVGSTAQANHRRKLYPHLDHLVALRGNDSDSGLPRAGCSLAQSRYDAPGKSPHSEGIFSLENFAAR